MKKKLLLCFLLTLVFALAAASCDAVNGIIDKISGGDTEDQHVHSGGTPTCTKAAVCTECGKTYGEKAEHSFREATCSSPRICTVCRYAEGTRLEHDYTEATCEEASTCKHCGDKVGKALGHTTGDYLSDVMYHWRVCETCGDQVDRAIHTGGGATCLQGKVCKDCGIEYTAKADHYWADATCDTPKTCVNCGITEGGVKHMYNKIYSYDDNGHWLECSKCGDKESEGVHTGGEATATERAQCEVCGARYGEYPEVVIDWEIEAEAPVSGSSVYLANELIRGWYAGYDYRTTDTDQFWLQKDIFAPVCPVLRWTVGEDAKYCKVFVANNSEMENAECYLTNLTEVKLEHLNVGTTYYWYVDAVYGDYTVRSEVFTFNTSESPRTVDIDGVSNSRDIGGYLTLDGKRIRQGMIYRSAKLDDITELGKYTLVNILGVKTDLDLRGTRTSDGSGGYYSDPKHCTHPVTELNHISVAAPWYSTGENGIWHDGFNKSEFAKAIKVFADPDNYPIIFHCSLGRDRTGTLSMVLGGLLGLDENTLMMEYELSVFSFYGTYDSSKYNSSLRNTIHDTYLYIENNYEGDTFSEKVEDFLLEIGVSADEIASIRSIMLEEVE